MILGLLMRFWFWFSVVFALCVCGWLVFWFGFACCGCFVVAVA